MGRLLEVTWARVSIRVRRVFKGGFDVNSRDRDGRTMLMKAASDGHLWIVRHLFKTGATVNNADNSGCTALILAAENGHLDVVEFLVKLGPFSADVNVADSEGLTGLIRAARNGRLSVVTFLLKAGAAVDAAGNDGQSALIWAAARGHLAVVKYLLEKGADLNATCNSKWTSLAWAARNGHRDVVKYLARRGADVNATDKYGEAALIRAARQSQWVVALCLLDCGAHVDTAGKDGWTAITFAAEFNQWDVVKYLAQCGADVDATTTCGDSILIRAAEYGRSDAVKHLIESGADMKTLIRAARQNQWDVVKSLVECGAYVDTTDSDGWTALTLAVESNRWDIVKYLASCGADVNITTSCGDSIMIRAAEYGRFDVVKDLIKCGADVKPKSDNQTALIRAAEFGHLAVARFLVESGADCNVSDNDGQTALMMAARNGHLQVVKYLVEIGADVKVINHNSMMAVAIAARHGHLDIHRMLVQHASRSTMTLLNAAQSAIVSSHSELLISPFDLNITSHVHDQNNSGADFIATWLDAHVALKMFVSDAANTTFYNEVTLWYQLRHPNVLKLYGACDVGHHLFVCELARKGSVVDYLQSCRQEEWRPWKYLYHAALGLAYLHERGIVHGDLRGSNILVGDDDQAKLANFGMSGSYARRRDTPGSATSRGFVGSMRWQPPEVLKGGQPSEASDVYAFGLCVTEILTGRIPWHGKDEQWVRFHKQSWAPGSNHDHWYEPADVWGDCRSLMEQLCCQDPALRHSASSCVRLIEHFAKQENNDSHIQTNQEAHITNTIEYWRLELSNLWTKIQNLHKCRCDATAATRFYPSQSIIDDLSQIYKATLNTPQPHRLVEQVYFLLRDTLKLVQNTSQTALVIQLSSTRATGSSIRALRRRVTDIMRQLGLDKLKSNDQDAQAIHEGAGDPYRAQETQMFISEISKTYLILNELETTEERSAFVSYLFAEINQHGGNYSVGQLAIMQQAYDDLKSRLDPNEVFATNLPVWFVPWYELTHWSEGHIEIGSGSYGSVHLAKWLDSDVVVKRLESSSLRDSVSLQSNSLTGAQRTSHSEERKMFEHEVNIWFNLSHPHVVRLFGACHVGRLPFFVCEYASNGSLDKYLLLHPDEIWEKLYEAALGLLYLHEHGIVHCDLKCNNIVVGSDGKAKVTDFGLSLAASVGDSDGADSNKEVSTDTSSNITGAWHWLSPELMLGRATIPTRESDVFSFGMCIIEALRVVTKAQTKPGGEETAPRVPWQYLDKGVVRHRMKRGEHLPDRPPGCSDVHWNLIEKMCKFNPNERIKMSTVVDELSMLAKEPNQDQPADTLLRTDVLSMVPSVKNHILHEKSNVHRSGSRDVIYQVHEMLWARIHDIQTQINAGFEGEQIFDASTRLQMFAVDAQSRSVAISTHADSLIDFTELALQAYGLHRRLDKLLAAMFLKIDNSNGASVHDWKQMCFKLLGVDPTVATQLLRRIKQPSSEASAT